MAKKRFKDLSEKEILALAIQLEEEDGRVYGDFAEGLRETYPATAKMFEDMQAEENRHGQSLIEMYRQRFGDHIPLIRRAPPGMAGAAAGHQHSAQAGRDHGAGDGALLRARAERDFGRVHTQAAGGSGRSRAAALRHGGFDRRKAGRVGRPQGRG